jgi:hypothetical protein
MSYTTGALMVAPRRAPAAPRLTESRCGDFFSTRERCHPALTGEASLGNLARTAEFDPDQLERLMVAALELLGRPEGQARELARAILRAAERPQPDDPEPPDRDPR